MTRYSITSACFAVVAVVLVTGAADIEYGKYLAGECVTCGFFDDDRETSEKAFWTATVRRSSEKSTSERRDGFGRAIDPCMAS